MKLSFVAGAAVLVSCAVTAWPHHISTDAPSRTAPVDRAIQSWLEHPAGTAPVLIRTKDGTSASVRARIARLGASITPSSSPDLLVARLEARSLEQTRRDPEVVSISSDAPVLGAAIAKTVTASLSTTLKTTMSTTTDLTASLTNLDTSHVLRTLAIQTSKNGGWVTNANQGAGVVVAVIDSGLDQNYTSLDWVDYYDATGGQVRHLSGRADDYGHGTHVSGLIASNGMSSSGTYRGVASQARLVVLKVLDAQGQGYSSDVINAVNYVTAHHDELGVKVINLSLVILSTSRPRRIRW